MCRENLKGTTPAYRKIAACAFAIGASYAGKCAVTITSGPGLALKQETIGLAVMTEIPLVVDRYEDYLHISEYERPHDRDPAEHANWLAPAVRAAVAELARAVCAPAPD